MTGLGRRFGKEWAVRDLNLKLDAGQILGLMGPNGAGKTTTLKMLATLEFPTCGDVRIDGASALEDPARVRPLIGFMPERFGLYENLTVFEYLDVFGRIHGFRGESLTRILEDVIDLTELTGRRDVLISSLSKGVRQRLFLAKTLIPDPPILLLDEPSSGLDPRARVDLAALLVDLKEQGKGIIISSHILSELESMVTHVAVMEAGVLVHSGPIQIGALEPRRTMELALLAGADEARIVLESRADVEIVSLTADHLLMTVHGDSRRVGDLLSDLNAAGVRFYTCRERTPSLEDVYLEVTRGLVT